MTSNVRFKALEKKVRRLAEKSEFPEWKRDLFLKIQREGLMVEPSEGDEVVKVSTESTEEVG